MSERDEARDLIARQKFRTDDRDLDGVSECWASDGRLELQFNDKPQVVVEGREAILKFVSNGWANTNHPHIHLISTLEIIDREDGRLGAESYCMYLSNAGDFAIHGYGRYQDILVREGGKLRLQSRSVRINSVF